MNLDELIESQRAFYKTGVTLPTEFRLSMLKKLYRAISQRRDAIAQALKKDLGKSETESYMCEIGTALSEISYLITRTPLLALPKPVPTPLSQFAAISVKQPSPYGNVLILSPWNYPFLLTIAPLADAIAAGNTAIVKPSSYAGATAAVVKELLSDCFPPEYICAVLGGREENSALLSKKFDFIFFTGSGTMGKEVLRRAAEHLTPAVLELGGKSPCIVDSSAKIRLTARRIVFGKFLNCGQTCVAPDYILCEERIKPLLIGAIVAEIHRQYGKHPLCHKEYGKIINEKHYNRLLGLIDERKVIVGGFGNPETLQIAPTVLDGVDWNDPIMQEEIFGPILPILTYKKWEDVIPLLQDKPKPLALYFFSENKERQRKLFRSLSFGGGCINDTVIHFATPHMGFGGVGESGMGSYHGKTGFYAFSHEKSIVDKKTFLDLPLRYRPHTEITNALLRLFLH